MNDSAKNRDPERAKARAVNDLRCAVRKLGVARAQELLDELKAEAKRSVRKGGAA